MYLTLKLYCKGCGDIINEICQAIDISWLGRKSSVVMILVIKMPSFSYYKSKSRRIANRGLQMLNILSPNVVFLFPILWQL